MKGNLKTSMMIFCLAIVTKLFAQDTKLDTLPPNNGDTTLGKPNKWRFLIEPYFFTASIQGSVGLDSLPITDVDADFDDLIDHVDFGFMVYMEAQNNKWAITSDLVYLELEQDANKNAIINSGEVKLKQVSWELAGLHRVFTFLEIGAGFRLNDIKLELDLNHNTSRGAKQSNWELKESWVDPIIVARTKLNFLDGLLYVKLRGDIGGFGFGSDLTWQAQLDCGVRIGGGWFQTSLGYRILSNDYEKGSGKDYFMNDTEMFGPVLRLGFRI